VDDRGGCNRIGQPPGAKTTAAHNTERETMASKLNPYLSFKGSARPAMEFYHTVFGGKLQMQTFGEIHAPVDASEMNNIMHAELAADNGILFYASDTPNHMAYQPGTNMSMSLTGEDEAELRGYFNKLAAGGAVSQALEKAPWGDTFGMLTDKFGVNWLVNITAPKP
jgi:PhnB protein